jgi:hypothetical protein
MKTPITIALFTFLAAGCVQVPKGHRAASLSFRSDPVNYGAGEAIEQLEIVVTSARVHRVGKIPTDWSAGVSRGQDGHAECTLNCLHENFAEPDIHKFDGVVSLLLTENDVRPRIKVRLWITGGPVGPGRITDLDEEEFFLR